jgi:hypothetical protein
MIIEIALIHMLHLREYQLIQEEDTRVRALIEPLPGITFDRERADRIMREQLQTYGLDQKLDVELETVEHLRSDGDHKFQRVVSKVQERDDKLSGVS